MPEVFKNFRFVLHVGAKLNFFAFSFVFCLMTGMAYFAISCLKALPLYIVQHLKIITILKGQPTIYFEKARCLANISNMHISFE